MGLTKRWSIRTCNQLEDLWIPISSGASPMTIPWSQITARDARLGFKFHWGFLLAEHQSSEAGKHWLRHTNQQSLLKVAWWGCEKNLLICRRSKRSWCVLLYRPKNTFQPIGSMYAIYGNIYHQYTPVMLAYIPYMDPMGNSQLWVANGCQKWTDFSTVQLAKHHVFDGVQSLVKIQQKARVFPSHEIRSCLKPVSLTIEGYHHPQ